MEKHKTILLRFFALINNHILDFYYSALTPHTGNAINKGTTDMPSKRGAAARWILKQKIGKTSHKENTYDTVV